LILKGVAYIHRDIKPSNILLNKEGKVKITDFGLALHFYETAHTGIVGTRDFRAPEILDREEHTEAVDIWAIGCIFAELMASEGLYYSKNSEEELNNVNAVIKEINLIKITDKIKSNKRVIDISCDINLTNDVSLEYMDDIKETNEMYNKLCEDKFIKKNNMLMINKEKDVDTEENKELISEIAYSSDQEQKFNYEINDNHKREVIEKDKDIYVIDYEGVEEYFGEPSEESGRVKTLLERIR